MLGFEVAMLSAQDGWRCPLCRAVAPVLCSGAQPGLNCLLTLQIYGRACSPQPFGACPQFGCGGVVRRRRDVHFALELAAVLAKRSWSMMKNTPSWRFSGM